jgi:membrane dipeptidase
MTTRQLAGPVADAHNDLLMAVQHFADDQDYFRRAWLPELRAGQVGVQVLPVYVDEEWLPELALRQTFRLIETALRTVESCPDELMLCVAPGDVERALAGGRIAIVLALEGCPAVGPDIGLLRTMSRLGVRMASLTHFGRNSLADGSAEDDTLGRLTRLGVRAIGVMQEIGLLVDLSHLSLAGTRHVLDITTGPVLATHSSCRAVHEHHRNLPDAELRAIAATGGVIGINFFPAYISAGPGSIDAVVDHIEHAAGVAGIEHVGLGPDFTKQLAQALYPGSHVIEGCDLAAAVPGLEGPADLPALAQALDRRGFTPADRIAVMGGNFRRLLNESIGTGAGQPTGTGTGQPTGTGASQPTGTGASQPTGTGTGQPTGTGTGQPTGTGTGQPTGTGTGQPTGTGAGDGPGR